MGFGKPLTDKPRKPEPVGRITGTGPRGWRPDAALVRIVVLALAATLAAAYGAYLYYTHAFLGRPRPAAVDAAPSGQIEIELSPSPSASP
jgi:hypothetical protein